MNDPLHVARRRFLRLIAAAPFGVAAFAEPLQPAAAAVIATAAEQGQPLVVRGVIYAADGRTPARGVRMSVYHTDSEGYYSRPRSDPRQARLRGALVTGADGLYELRTILPGHYPGTTIERHIHVHLAPPGLPEHWVDSFLFEGDPHLSERDAASSRAAGPFRHVMPAVRDAGGVLQATRDFRIDAGIAQRNQLVNGWYREDEEHGG
jgi:protocatechuate 3,4-dioxygenase, beta subunit